MQTYRHGDLTFHPTQKPEELNMQEHDGAFVLALGEHTGHKHVITQEEGTLEIGRDTRGNIFLVIDGKAVLTHEEHKPITLETGVYQMKVQIEYDPFEAVIREVAD